MIQKRALTQFSPLGGVKPSVGSGLRGKQQSRNPVGGKDSTVFQHGSLRRGSGHLRGLRGSEIELAEDQNDGETLADIADDFQTAAPGPDPDDGFAKHLKFL